MTIQVKSRDFGDFQSLERTLGVSTKVAQILSSRGVTNELDVDYSLKHLLPLDDLPGIEEGSERIVKAIVNQEKLLICGDFDADGATASALCMLFFRSIDFTSVDYRVPDRFVLGYGLTAAFVERLLVEEPDLIVTVDNGVASMDGIALATEHGIDVVVTDHHLPSDDPEGVPDACAIVNPHMPGSTFQSSPCGVGVAFYLLSRVRRKLINSGFFDEKGIEPPNMVEWLDIVALGTVVDMVPLDLNNRRIVNEGVKRMRAGFTRPGIKALCEVSNTDLNSLRVQDMSFRLGPRINAAGRLDDIGIGIKLLIEDEPEQAFVIALRLHEINSHRQEIQKTMSADASEILELDDGIERNGYCLFHPNFQEGVVGLVATKVCRELGRPAVVFAKGVIPENSDHPAELKGSARSIDGVHIRDLLALIDARYPKLIRRFGGHAAAAGLTIAENSFTRFAKIFENIINEHVPASVFEGVIETDGELGEKDLNLNFLSEINSNGPWGQAFPFPTFHGYFDVIDAQSVGKEKEHQKFLLQLGSKKVDAIAFNHPPVNSDTVFATYQLSRNEFHGNVTLQLILDKIEGVNESD